MSIRDLRPEELAERLEDASYLCEKLRISLATLDRRLKDPMCDLPRPVKRYGRSRKWRRGDVDAYVLKHDRDGRAQGRLGLVAAMRRIDDLTKRIAALEANEPERDPPSFP